MTGDRMRVPAVDIHLQLVLDALHVHNLRLQGGVLLHVLTIDAIEFCEDADLEVIDVVDDLLLHALELRPSLHLLPLAHPLIVRQVALFHLQQLVNLLREQFCLLHHVPQLLRVHRNL